MGLDLLSLSPSTIERIAMVALDEPEWVGTEGNFWERGRKRYCLFKLRLLGHRGIFHAAHQARHHVVRANYFSAALIGDLDWARLLFAAEQVKGKELMKAEREEFGSRDDDSEPAPSDGGEADHAIYRAARHGLLPLVRVLVEEFGGDPDSNWTPLCIASKYGHLNVVKYLLEKGADPTAGESDGEGPLTFAMNRGGVGFPEIEAVLRAAGGTYPPEE